MFACDDVRCGKDFLTKAHLFVGVKTVIGHKVLNFESFIELLILKVEALGFPRIAFLFRNLIFQFLCTARKNKHKVSLPCCEADF